MRKISLALAFVASLLALPAQAANFSAKDAAAATIVFVNPGNCTTGCTPIFAWSDSTGANLVAVITAGADAASNTANGGIVYNRNMVFNGTTWDRWQGAISIASGKVASGAFASGALASGSIASGAVASGAVASGAYAAGSLAAGAGVDGWDLTQGAIADAAATAGSTGSVSAKLRLMTSQLNTISANTGAAIPAQSSNTVNIGAVMNAGSKYLAVAASQTATVLQTSTGAAGDYLSHCVIYPTSTSPGAVTVFDNTNTAATSAILFAGGASSTSNLTPVSVPVGAVSTAGAWKVTTGSAVSVVCFGKFS